MGLFRLMIATLALMAWFIASNSCLLATTFTPVPDECCEHDSGEPEMPMPCGASDCAKCVTLESGINPTVLTPLSAPDPFWNVDHLLSAALLDLLQALAVERVHFPDKTDPPPLRWCDVIPKVVPVRGPSLIA